MKVVRCRKCPMAAGGAPGMTLVEILVAVTVGSVLVLAMASLLARASDLYARSDREMRVTREGRVAIERIRRDLVGRLASYPYFQRDETGPSTTWAFFSAMPARAQETGRNAGDVCYIAYTTRVTPDRDGRFSRKLYRHFESSNDALARLRSHLAVPPDVNLEMDDVLAFDVLDFKVTFLVAGPDGKRTETKDPQEADTAVLALRLLTTKATAEMAAESDWSPPGNERLGFDFDDNEEDDANARTFRMQVRLKP